MCNLKHVVLFLLCTGLAQCNRNHTNVEGKWALQSVELNKAMVEKSLLQGSFYQFTGNEYTSQIVGMNDEGTYRINGDSIFLKSSIVKERPETWYLMAQGDSTQLILKSSINGNDTRMQFTKAALQ